MLTSCHVIMILVLVDTGESMRVPDCEPLGLRTRGVL